MRAWITALGLAVVAVLLLLAVSWDYLLNHWVAPRIESAVSRARPGSSLRIDHLEYDFWRNRIVCQQLAFRPRNATWSAQIGSISVTGVPWISFAFGRQSAPLAFSRSEIQVLSLRATFTNALYQISCANLHASMPLSRVEASDVKIHPSVSDENFFAAVEYRRARLRAVVQHCALTGLDTDALLGGETFRADLLQLEGASLDSLISRDKPRNRHPDPTLMLNEALALVRQPLEIRALQVNGVISLQQRLAAGQEPGTLTFEDFRLAGEGIKNAAAGGGTMVFHGQTKLMGTGVMKARLELPVTPSGWSFQYSGSLGPMPLTNFNPFLVGAIRTRIDAGALYELTFATLVTNGHAQGTLHAAYDGLKLQLLDRETASEKGVVNHVKTFVADHLILRDRNMPVEGKSMKVGQIEYTREEDEKFVRLLWMPLRSGLLDLLGLSQFVSDPK